MEQVIWEGNHLALVKVPASRCYDQGCYQHIPMEIWLVSRSIVNKCFKPWFQVKDPDVWVQVFTGGKVRYSKDIKASLIADAQKRDAGYPAEVAAFHAAKAAKAEAEKAEADRAQRRAEALAALTAAALDGNQEGILDAARLYRQEMTA